MTIINPLPYTIVNGDPVDATPVQADLNQIVSNVNANAAAVAGNAAQEFLVATTTNPAGATPLMQVQSQFAAISGSSANTFAVASGTGSSAVPYTLLSSYAAPISGNASQTFAVSQAPSGSVFAPQIAQSITQGFSGIGSNLSGSRAINTVYINNTSRPLVVCAVVTVTTSSPGSGFQVVGIINSQTVVNFYPIEISPGPTAATVQLIVPSGASYEIYVDVSASVATWYEY